MKRSTPERRASVSTAARRSSALSARSARHTKKTPRSRTNCGNFRLACGGIPMLRGHHLLGHCRDDKQAFLKLTGMGLFRALNWVLQLPIPLKGHTRG
jgi:hypothetical protein